MAQDLDETSSKSYNTFIQSPFTMTTFKLKTISDLGIFSPIDMLISDLKFGQKGWTTIGPGGNTDIYYLTTNRDSGTLDWFIKDTILKPNNNFNSVGAYSALVERLCNGALQVTISSKREYRQNLREYFDQKSNSLDYTELKNFLDVSEVIINEPDFYAMYEGCHD